MVLDHHGPSDLGPDSAVNVHVVPVTPCLVSSCWEKRAGCGFTFSRWVISAKSEP